MWWRWGRQPGLSPRGGSAAGAGGDTPTQTHRHRHTDTHTEEPPPGGGDSTAEPPPPPGPPRRGWPGRPPRCAACRGQGRAGVPSLCPPLPHHDVTLGLRFGGSGEEGGLVSPGLSLVLDPGGGGSRRWHRRGWRGQRGHAWDSPGHRGGAAPRRGPWHPAMAPHPLGTGCGCDGAARRAWGPRGSGEPCRGQGSFWATPSPGHPPGTVLKAIPSRSTRGTPRCQRGLLPALSSQTNPPQPSPLALALHSFPPAQLSPDPHHPSPGARGGLVGVKVTVGSHSSQLPPVWSPSVLAVLQGPSLLQTTRANIQTGMTERQQLPGRVPTTPMGCKWSQPARRGIAEG